MGLLVSIFKDRGNSYSNGGVSANHDKLVLVNVAGPFEPTADAPGAHLVKGNLPGCVKIIPAKEDGTPDTRWLMFGGTFVYSSDSRFHNAVSEITGVINSGAVPFHDRYEA